MSVQAAVVINEVAWMGNAVSANDEWIELHNNGSTAVSVDGWTLSDGQSLSVALAGTIDAGAYAVIERTDDESAPGTAFLVYTGALSNTGATLTLRDAAGAITDQVSGGENWTDIGGDNVTKETAQYTPSGWVTAVATPGAQNATESSTPQAEMVTAPKKVSGGRVVAKPAERETGLVPSTNALELNIETPAVIYVNQPVTFKALPANIGETITNSLVYQWNFGDISTATGTTVTHTYTHPGEYLVTLKGAYARHDVLSQASVTVLPVQFSMTKSAAGDVQIHNDAPYAIDVSGFRVGGQKTVTFPPLSFIPARGTVTIVKEKLGAQPLPSVRFYDRTRTLVATLSETPQSDVVAHAVASSPTTISRASPAPLAAFAFAAKDESLDEESTILSKLSAPVSGTASSVAPVATALSADADLPRMGWPTLGLVGVIVLGLASIYAGSQKS